MAEPINLADVVLKRVFSVRDVMALTGIGNETIRAAIHNGGLRARDIGQAFYILPADLDAWLESLPPVATGPKIVLSSRARRR